MATPSVFDEPPGVKVTVKDDYGVWKNFQTELAKQLPLKNVPVTNKFGTVYTVPSLPIELVPFQDFHIGRTYGVPALWYQIPYMHLYMVHCEDVETYKKIVQPKLKDWVSKISATDAEYLIVYVGAGYFSNSGKTFKKIFDRMKSEFNDAADRCCQLRLSMDEQDKDLWMDFLARLRAGLVGTYSTRAARYEDQIRALDAGRANGNFDWPRFFLVKEGLALMHGAFCLHEELLRQYDELEGYYVDQSKPLTPPSDPAVVARLIGSDPSSTSALVAALSNVPVADPTVLPYRSMIRDSTLHDLAFRTYLVARQAGACLALSKTLEAAQRYFAFIQQAASDLGTLTSADLTDAIPKDYAAVWVFSASQAVVSLISSKIPAPKQGPPSSPNQVSSTPRDPSTARVHNIVADLIYFGRRKLDILARAYGRSILSTAMPGSPAAVKSKSAASSPTSQPSSPSSLPTLSTAVLACKSLIASLQSTEAYESAFTASTKLAAAHYAAAGRRRSVTRLNGELADLHYHRGQFEDAEMLLKNLASMYAEDGWADLVFAVRTKLAKTHLALKHYPEYITTALGQLSAGPQADKDAVASYAEGLVDVVHTKIDSTMTRALSPPFDVSISLPSPPSVPLGQSITLELHFVSPLSVPFLVDDIRCALIPSILAASSPGSSSAPTPSTSQDKTPEDAALIEAVVSNNDSGGEPLAIQPGRSVLKAVVDGHTLPAGSFLPTQVKVRLGYLTLIANLPRTTPVISVIPSRAAAQIKLDRPPILLLGHSATLNVVVESHTDHVSSASLLLSDCPSLVVHDTPSTPVQAAGVDGVTYSVTDGQILLKTPSSDSPSPVGAIPPDTKLSLPIQVSVAPSSDASMLSQIKLSGSFVKSTEESFSLSATVGLVLCKAFSLDAHIHSLKDRAVVQLIVACSAHMALTLRAGTLTLPDQLQDSWSVSPADNSVNTDLVLRPGARTSYVFWLDSVGNPSASSSNSANMQPGSDSGDTSASQDTAKFTLPFSVAGRDLQEELDVNLSGLGEVIYDVAVTLKETTIVPSVGVPMDFSVTISAHQTELSSPDLAGIAYTMNVDEDSWLVAGPVRGVIPTTSSDGPVTTHTVPLRLIPLLAGQLWLPRLVLDSISASSVLQTQLGQQITVAPAPTVSSGVALPQPGSAVLTNSGF